jgi:subtilisin family serine protease
MVAIDPKAKKYIITFKRKDQRPNGVDDKIAIFRQIIGLEDIRDILDISKYTGDHMHDPIQKTETTVTDINSYENPFIGARLTSDQVGRLRRDPNISSVNEGVTYHTAEEFPGWQVDKLTAPQTWAAPLSARGAGVNVAIMDTGCQPHLDINANLKLNQNFTARPGTASEDSVHHGTHVAGICGAIQGNNEGIQGIAPNCNIWNLRAGDQNGIFAEIDMVEALEFARQNNAHVVNMSVTSLQFSSQLEGLMASLANQGIVMCGAVGNTGRQETVTYPAGYTGVIGVSNLAIEGALSVTSTWGTMVDVTAPGRDIQSLGENNLYRVLDGTSMACPSVSGVCALMLSAYANTGCPPYDVGATKAQIIEKVLTQTTTKTGLIGAGAVGTKDIRYGFGLPVARIAVASLKGVLPSALA